MFDFDFILIIQHSLQNPTSIIPFNKINRKFHIYANYTCFLPHKNVFLFSLNIISKTIEEFPVSIAFP